MTVTAPPRPQKPSDRSNPLELEALIEEARQRARRRRGHRAALVGLILLAGAAAFLGVDRVTGGGADATAVTHPSGGLGVTGGRSEIVFSTWRNSRGTIYRIFGDGTGLRRLTPEHGPAWPVLSPDGRQIAFAFLRIHSTAGSTSMSSSVELMNSDGTERGMLVEDGVSPTWSPDGSRIAFAGSKRLGGTYVINVNGRHLHRLTRGCSSPGWSPDGSRIVYSCGPSTTSGSLWVMNADGTGRHQIASRGSARSPAWSPDGSTIAFESGFPDTRVYVMSADGIEMRRLPPRINYKNQDCNVAWSPDGKRLAFSPVFFGRSGIYLMNADGTHVTRLRGAPNYACGISWRRAPLRR